MDEEKISHYIIISTEKYEKAVEIAIKKYKELYDEDLTVDDIIVEEIYVDEGVIDEYDA